MNHTTITAPPTDLDALVDTWDAHHPAATDHPDWRHQLDEIAHPETVEALYRLAECA